MPVASGGRSLSTSTGGVSARSSEATLATVASLRDKIERLQRTPARANDVARRECVPTPATLEELLPDGGLARGALFVSNRCPMLIVELIAHVSARGQHVAVVGWPELGLGGVAEAGGDLRRVVVVPDPGAAPMGVLGVLVEGMDLVIYRGAEAALTPTRLRPLSGKLRGGSAALVVVGAQLAAPRARIRAEVAGFSGIGRGAGRIRSVDLAVSVEARGRITRGWMTVGVSQAQAAVLPGAVPPAEVTSERDDQLAWPVFPGVAG